MVTKKIIIFIIGVFGVFANCSSDDETVKKEPPKPPKKEEQGVIPEWNKANTASVYFVSKFNDKPISKINYPEISTFLKEKSFHAIIIDRSDINLNSGFNGGVTVVDALKKYSVYNLLEIKEPYIKGTTIIFNNPLNRFSTYKINTKSQLTTIDVLLKKEINIPLAITTLSSEAQFTDAKKLISRMVSENKVVLLKAKSSLLDLLKSTTKKINTKYRVQEFSTQKEYSIVIVCPKYWLPRKVEKVKSLSDNLQVYNMQIEANVFY